MHQNCNNTPLIWASRYGHIKMVERLLEAKAQIEVQEVLGNSPLILAAGYGRDEVVKMLLEAGADKNLKDTFGNDALYHSKSGRHPSITKLLEVEDIVSAPSGTPATEYIKEGEAKGVILPPQPPPKPAEPAKDEVAG